MNRLTAKLNLAILILLFLVCSLSGQIINKTAIAAATVIKGKVWIKTGLQPRHLLKPGQQIFPNDTVFTSDSGYAEITFLHGKRIIKLQSKSELIFQIKKDRKDLLPRIMMKIGKIWMKITGSPADTEIDTPNAVVSVKGTEFLLIFDPETGTWLSVLNGVVELSNDLGKVLVSREQQSRVENGKSPTPPESIRAEKIIEMWHSKRQDSSKIQIRDALLQKLIEKFGLADSLKDYVFDNVKIRGGDRDITEYLQFILKQNSKNVRWELETTNDGTRRLKIIIDNFQPKKP